MQFPVLFNKSQIQIYCLTIFKTFGMNDLFNHCILLFLILEKYAFFSEITSDSVITCTSILYHKHNRDRSRVLRSVHRHVQEVFIYLLC